MTPDGRVEAVLTLAVLFGLCGLAAAQDENGEARGNMEQVEAANVLAPGAEVVTSVRQKTRNRLILRVVLRISSGEVR